MSSSPPLRILWVGTKPPCPATDGGRLVAKLTLEELSRQGHATTLVVPRERHDRAREHLEELHHLAACHLVLAPLPHPLIAALRSLVSGTPYSIARHRHPVVRQRLQRLLADDSFDLIHVEQLQAMAQVPPSRLPVLLRAQNVESDLWAQTAATLAAPASTLAAWERRRMASWERHGARRAGAVVALTEEDANRLAALSSTAVVTCPPPFPADLSPGPPLPGDPALVLLADERWRPNREARRWFVEAVWPDVCRRLPQARLHLFGEHGAGGASDRVSHHGAPASSRTAFAENGILLVPLGTASGIRMKILEAWSRRVPVVATPEAASGLGAGDGRELLLGDSAPSLTLAIVRLQESPGLRAGLVERGNAHLRRIYDPTQATLRLVRIYQRLRGARSQPPA